MIFHDQTGEGKRDSTTLPHIHVGISKTELVRSQDGGNAMTERKVWFVTGAARGMGLDFAKAVLAAGDSLVASGRNTDRLSMALEPCSNLLTVKLDVTHPADAEAAVNAAVDRFGRIDVLINNA